MDRAFVENKLYEITEKIATAYQPEKIILFGSYAWGEPGPDSDVDLFIVKESVEQRIDRARAVQKLIFGSKIPVDVLVYTPAEIERRLSFDDPFINHILKNGKILWMKKNS